MEGYISKRTIRFWLENYEAMVADDRPLDAIPGNSGPKDVDGITDTHLNRIMLQSAIKNLPKLEQAVCIDRWVRQKPVRQTCKELGITVDKYYYRCDKAVDLIHKDLNGGSLGMMDLIYQVRG